MRTTCLVVCMVVALVVAGCRPAITPAPGTPLPSTNSVSPLPTPIAPQLAPTITHEGSASPASTPIAASGIQLSATIGPTCPGPERPGQICTQPYEGLFVVTAGSGAEVARATTDQNGNATIDLPPGNYTIVPKIEGQWPSGAPVAVSVPAGQYVEVHVELDSGIR